MNRRNFITSTLVASVLPSFLSGRDTVITHDKMSVKINIGVITGTDNPERDVQQVREYGFECCQVGVNEFTPGLSDRLKLAFERNKVTPVSMICHGPGPYIYDFKNGPSTIGLIPRKYRMERIERLKNGIDFCKATGIPAVQAHFGFIPEDPKDILYIEFIQIMKELGEFALKKKIDIYFETGQETPVTLSRAIEDVGTGNLFVNYDTANLVLYGKANPLDGLLVLGKYVKSLHAKDGLYPTNPYELGKEMPIPEGIVDFPGIISYLKKNDFGGSIIIENEMSSNTREYLVKTKKYLENLMDNT